MNTLAAVALGLSIANLIGLFFLMILLASTTRELRAQALRLTRLEQSAQADRQVA
jgi:hypothetical protein